MGGCCSSEQEADPEPTISQPQNLILHVPRPQVDYDGRPVRIDDYELDKATLQGALARMADYIDNQGQSITVITVGGAVNTILLQNRQSTHDVDFFGTNLNNDQRVILDEAARYAERKSPTPLGGEWFNSHTMLWLSIDAHRRITQEALEQNEVVFEKRGFRVLAAPWNYAMCGKMNRLVRGDEARPYDLSDAASYLRQFIQRHGGPVSVATIKNWCRYYAKSTDDEVIRATASEYRRLYGEAGIVE
jgi:hypothetical protein